ncbi:transposase [Azotobacter chroococcum]|uniref:transposase n=1 Tax=Azotobacter chroococcum TaxID=353 RepID=UPI00146A49C7
MSRDCARRRVANAGYGNDTGFRDGLTERGLTYAVGVQGTTTVWPESEASLPSKPWKGVGRKPSLLRRDAEHRPISVKALELGLPSQCLPYRHLAAGQQHGTSRPLADGRTRRGMVAHRVARGTAGTGKYVLSTLPADTSFERLVAMTKMRWRIERDYQELK